MAPGSVVPSLLYFLPLAGYWLVLIYYLGAQWSVYEQYHYGWAVPFLCLYLLWRHAERQRSGNAPPPTLFSVSAFQRFSIFLLCLLYAPVRFFHEANPIWRLTSLLWALIVIGLTLLVLWVYGSVLRWSVVHSQRAEDERQRSEVRGQRSEVRGQRSEVRSQRSEGRGPSSASGFQHSGFSFSAFLFPICFFLVAVPWPSAAENFLIQSLMRLNVATTIELLGLLGIPAVQHGNVIEIGAGMVGVDEACSGIRSFQATLMIALFLGELYRLALVRRFGVVLLALVLAFAFNVGRTLVLTGVASAKGVAAVSSWHDPASVTILVACFLCVWLLAWLLKGNAEMLKTGMLKAEIGAASPTASGPVVHGPVVSLSLLAWLLLVEAGTEFWYRFHESPTAAQAEWSVRHPAPSASYREVEIPSDIRGQFRSDDNTHARWVDGSGGFWELYYFRWFPARSLQKRVAIQLAKTHGPEKCLPAVGMRLKSYQGIATVPVAGMELALQHYVFSAEGRLLHVFYGIYEDPTGSTRLANRRKDFASRVAAALAGSRNYGQRFLEIAVTGYDRPEAAKAALAPELEKLIRVETPAPGG